MAGSTTQSMAVAAIAASTALPPLRITSDADQRGLRMGGGDHRLRAVDGGAPGALEITVQCQSSVRRRAPGLFQVHSSRLVPEGDVFFACMNANSHCAAARGVCEKVTRSSTAIGGSSGNFRLAAPRPTRPHYVHMQGSCISAAETPIHVSPAGLPVAWNRAGEPDETSKV